MDLKSYKFYLRLFHSEIPEKNTKEYIYTQSSQCYNKNTQVEEQVVLIKMIINTLIKTLIIQQKAPEEVPTPEASSNSAADMMFALVRIKLHFFFFKFFQTMKLLKMYPVNQCLIHVQINFMTEQKLCDKLVLLQVFLVTFSLYISFI